MKLFLILMPVSWLIAETTTTGFDPTTLLTQIGIGGVIATPFYFLWRDERKQRLVADAKLIDFLEKQGPLLAEAVKTLERVQGGMEHVVERSSAVPDRNDWDRALRRVELVGDELRSSLRNVQKDKDKPDG